jgi:bifunctional DNA primase/polymerase-like protein/uncharacterized protein DUF5906
MSHNLSVALKWAAAGAHILVTGPDKKARVKWRDTSTTDADTIKNWFAEWPDSLPAIDLAKSGVVVIDGDRHGGPDGVAAVEEMLAEHKLNGAAIPTVVTPQDGRHYWFRQPTEGEPIGNSDKAVRSKGVNIRAAGGYVIAPGTMLPDGRRYIRDAATPSTLEALYTDTIPVLPPAIVGILRKPNGHDVSLPHKMNGHTPILVSGSREQAYARAALENLAGALAAMAPDSGRNIELNNAALRLGHMVGASWIGRATVEGRLFDAAMACGLVSEDGSQSVRSTIKSGLDKGEIEPHAPLEERPGPLSYNTKASCARTATEDTAPGDEGISLDDFHAYMPQHSYIYIPSRDMWPASSVNARIAPVPIVDANGKPALDDKGNQKVIAANKWLDQNRPVTQMTWAPGEPLLIENRLISDGGWFDRKGDHCLNIYRPPVIRHGEAAKVGPWLDHVRKIYPADAEHLVRWLAHRVQHPGQKINHAIVLGGNQGIGKDTLLEPVKHAIGPWNFIEVSPAHMLGRFNGYLKSVVLRINEARDLGEINRYQFYDHMKAYTAAPPDVLRVDEKNLREYSIVNCCGVIITSNHKSDGIFLPSDDRRHYVAWSNFNKEDFDANYWNRLWGWYLKDGFQHVAAYLAGLDISGFDPKAPPPKTNAFWEIVNANRSPEDAELADVLDQLGNPNAVTLGQVKASAQGGFFEWLADRKNRRVLPHRLEACGYTPVRNPSDKRDGQWKIRGERQTVYAKNTLSEVDRLRAAQQL